MNRRYIFIITGALLIASSVTLVIVSQKMSGPAFYIAEAVMVLCVILLYLFYTRLIRPLNMISNDLDRMYREDVTIRVKPGGEPGVDRIIRMFNDMMTRLKEEEVRLREQNHFLDMLIESSSMGILTLCVGDRMEHLNPAALKFLEIPPECNVEGMFLTDIESPLAKALADIQPGRDSIVRLGNSRVYRCARHNYMAHGVPHPFILIDQLTEEVIKAEKKAYGKVIRMISHEVNNSMGGVESVLDSIKSEVGNSELETALDVCMSRCRSMSGFITSMADMVKIPEAKLVDTDLNAFIGDTVRLLESMCAGRDIRLAFRPTSGAVMVGLDVVLMEQVLINIVKNAAESIGSGGEINISVSDTPRGFVVADNGKGLSPEVEQNLFTPFYSSKSHGRGLGLLLASDVLRKHHCEFSLRTCSDSITRFSVFF